MKLNVNIEREVKYSNLGDMMRVVSNLQNKAGKWDEKEMKRVEYLEEMSKKLVKEQGGG